MQTKYSNLSPISEFTWARLVSASTKAVEAGWATPGVFATAVGPDFIPGSANTLLYVGKSGGPLIDDVGVVQDQLDSCRATTKWMVEKRNPSAFWVFADLLVSRREHMAWSNLAKIDAKGACPPKPHEWRQIADACATALREEMVTLAPKRTVLATSNFQRETVKQVLSDLGFTPHSVSIDLDETQLFTNENRQLAAITRHPQGWKREPRDLVAKYIREWM